MTSSLLSSSVPVSSSADISRSESDIASVSDSEPRSESESSAACSTPTLKPISASSPQDTNHDADAPAHRIRLRFAKRGDLRLISHHDLMRTVERMIRRAELPMASSQGFNPRPKIVFAMALGLGIEGRREILELELKVPLSPRETRRRLAEQAPDGLDFFEEVALQARAAERPIALVYSLEVPHNRRIPARSALEAFLATATWPFVRRRPDRAPTSIDLRPSVLKADLTPTGELQIRLAVSDSGGSARPEEILDVLGLRDLLTGGAALVRSDIELGLPASRASQSTSAPAPISAAASASAPSSPSLDQQHPVGPTSSASPN